jgi:hypothetical protein
MSKSNGYRRVNKADGPKKLGKKALVKSRRNDHDKIISEGYYEQERIKFENQTNKFLNIFRIAVKDAKKLNKKEIQ